LGDSSGSYVTGAASASIKVGPKQTAEATIVLGWSFPDRDFIGLQVGGLLYSAYGRPTTYLFPTPLFY